MSYFRTLGPRLLAQGYTIVPIPRGSKGPRLDDWRNLHLQASTFEEWCKGTWTKVTDDGERQIPNTRDTDGVGINTTGNPAVDVDEYDEAIVKQVQAFMSDNLDAVGPRRIGKAPKSLFLFRTDTPFAKIQSSTWKDSKGRACKCEILGDGQQFVAYHIHPDTLRPYVWPDEWESPVDVAAADLPVLTETAAKAICSFYDKLCSEAGRSKVSDASSGGDDSGEALAREAPPPETDYEITRVKKALDHISADCSRSEYLAVLAGLKWTGWMCSEEIAHEWAEKSEEGKFDERDFQRDWRSLEGERIGKRTTTLGSVISMAVKAGFDASRKDEPKLSVEEARTLYAGISDRIQSIKPDDREEMKAIVKAIAEAGLDTLDERALLKSLAKAMKISIVDLKHGVREAKAASTREHDEPTHARYAKRLLDTLADEHGARPKTVDRVLWLYHPDIGIWKSQDVELLTNAVVANFDGLEGCMRGSDYNAIAKQAMNLAAAGAEMFFQDAPKGLACEKRFYSIEDGEIVREALVASHRQKMIVNFAPRRMPTPLWDKFMADTFEGDVDQEQEHLIEEIAGGVLLNIAHTYQKAILFKGVSRAGKSILQTIIAATMPPEFVTGIAPEKWDDPYYRAAMANARLNNVGELSEDKPIDPSSFKRVIGQDPIEARHPSGRPFMLVNGALHCFNSNFFVPTKEHTEAFYSRWILVEFRNSRLQSDKTIDPELCEKIIAAEMPGITARFLAGAQRLLKRGKFPVTRAHVRLMEQWRRRAASSMEFLMDTDFVGIGEPKGVEPLRRRELYDAYRQWCRDSGRHPVKDSKFYDEIEGSVECASLGIKLVNHSHYRLVRGLHLTNKVFGVEVQWDKDADDDY